MSDIPPLPPVPRLPSSVIDKAADAATSKHGEGQWTRLPSFTDRRAAQEARREHQKRKSDLE